MDVILAGKTGYEFWQRNTDLLSRKPTPIHTNRSASLHKREALLLASDEGLSLPIVHLVGAKEQRAGNGQQRTVMRDCGKLPCIVPIHEGLSVATPELCFLQLANELSLPQLIFFGYRFCSTYCHNEFSPTGLTSRIQLMTPESARAFLAKVPTTQGTAKAKKALPFIAAKADSPKEIESSMRLTLPYSLGGYKLPLPELNKEISLTTNPRSALKRTTLRPDLFWKDAKLLAEYQSDLTHLSPEQFHYDLKRMNAFIGMGYRQISICSDHLARIESMDLLAADIAKLLGKRIRPSIDDFHKRQVALVRCIHELIETRL
ncbi:MAG: hypothetical protein IJH83_05835 [Coriobacteriales bacterium]|nr:hypothetical protein [Coriobacteriales bacterium]